MVFLPRAPHRCSPKCPSSPCRLRWQRLAFCVFRLLKVGPTALLILLDANRSWRDVLRRDCPSMWLQAYFVNQVPPQPDGPRLLSWCDFATTSTRHWRHMIKHGRDPMLRRMLGMKIPHNPVEFFYLQTYNYSGFVTSVVCALPLIVL